MSLKGPAGQMQPETGIGRDEGHRRSLLERRHDGDVLTLTMNSSATRNALSEAMMAALQGALDEARHDKGLRAIIVAAEGPAFCAGHDLKELSAHRSDDDGGRAFFASMMSQCAALMQTIVHSPKPVIAAIEAMATAAGCQLVASCDLAVAGAAARFCTPGVNIGLFCSTPMVALTRNISRKRAMEMLLLGEVIDAAAAADFGLVNHAVAAGGAMARARAMADIIAAKSSATVAIGKEAFYRQIEQPLADAYDYAADVMVRNMMHADAEEGIGAFIEKRKPQWCG